jgi:lactate dehydrogenase-like 2-hydroxyacid dehydrogenase
MADGMILLMLERAALRERLGSVPFVEAEDIAALPAEVRGRIRVVLTTGMQRLGGGEFDLLPRLGLVVAIGAGFDGVDVDALAARGIQLATGGGLNHDDVAEFAVGQLIALCRGLVSADAVVREGRWPPGHLRVPRRSVAGRTVGIVGLGRIGLAIAERLAPFKCRIAWTGPRPKDGIGFDYVPDVLELARQSDVLMIAPPLNAETRHLIDAPVLDALGPEGLIVNVARGGVVDEDALVAALHAHRIAGAALDVFAEEPASPQRWANVPNTLLSPHIAGVTTEAMAAVYDLAAERAVAFLREG